MGSEKRKYVRRAVSYPGKIDLGGGQPMRACTLHDVSDQGALITLAQIQDLPDEFSLVLGYHGTARRQCQVVWRSDRQIGVEFVRDIPAL
jgi:hypothetical protein